MLTAQIRSRDQYFPRLHRVTRGAHTLGTSMLCLYMGLRIKGMYFSAQTHTKRNKTNAHAHTITVLLTLTIGKRIITSGSEGFSIKALQVLAMAASSLRVLLRSSPCGKKWLEEIMRFLKTNWPLDSIFFTRLELRLLRILRNCIQMFFSYNMIVK